MIKKSTIKRLFAGSLLLICVPGFICSLAPCSRAADPNDPFDSSLQDDVRDLLHQREGNTDFDSDDKKTAEELISEANFLFIDERPLDARTKLLKALKKDPRNYKAHTLLGGYYLIHVGHFRLALKYIKRALELFKSQNGEPPYEDQALASEHARILYLLSETRLNLDNYQGALDALDNYRSFYFASWYPGSRAWVLMKLGRIDEAIKTARLGVLTGSDLGRTLNILGILLSMSDKRQESLEIFNQAIMYEFSLGEAGQPATPLNNSGEVYHEIFEEDKAEASWLKATGLPDGCEHVLPSLNLVILYLEQLKFKNAKKAMDDFERCIVQYPLRNGEEHRALVHLARGRIDLHTGKIDSAISHLEEALERRQWFGKIGTNEEDLEAGALISLAQAFRKKNFRLSYKRNYSFAERILSYRLRIANYVRSWWLMRRARQILGEDLNDMEDLHIRNTDSMLEYHTFGDLLETVPGTILRERIKKEKENDPRKQAQIYYDAYLAQNYLAGLRKGTGLKILNRALLAARPIYDDGLKLHLMLLKLGILNPATDEAVKIAEEAYKMAPAELLNYNHRLPVNVSGLDKTIAKELKKSAFIPVYGKALEYSISGDKNGKYHLVFSSRDNNVRYRAEGESVKEALDKLTNLVFTQSLKIRPDYKPLTP